jgi:hypothetical protein
MGVYPKSTFPHPQLLPTFPLFPRARFTGAQVPMPLDGTDPCPVHSTCMRVKPHHRHLVFLNDKCLGLGSEHLRDSCGGVMSRQLDLNPIDGSTTARLLSGTFQDWIRRWSVLALSSPFFASLPAGKIRKRGVLPGHPYPHRSLVVYILNAHSSAFHSHITHAHAPSTS